MLINDMLINDMRVDSVLTVCGTADHAQIVAA
jgi:hypothetical protein